MVAARPWALLRRAVARERVAHAYLFTGAPGQGQLETAICLAQALRCPRRTDGEPCGQCSECAHVATGVHPAVIRVRPAGASLKLDQVREALRPLQWRAAPGDHRLVLFEDAERLTPEAANRLLKVLEEPPPDTVMVLLAASAERLPETVVSRCQVVHFAGLPEGDVAATLRAAGEEPARALALARLAGGNAGRAASWRDEGLLDGVRKAVLHGLRRLGEGDPLAALEVADAWSGLEAEQVLDMVEALIRDVDLVRRGISQYVWNVDVQDELVALAARSGRRDALEEGLRTTAAARRALEAHAPRQLVLEVACLQLQETLWT